jgi:hypothetical protein
VLDRLAVVIFFAGADLAGAVSFAGELDGSETLAVSAALLSLGVVSATLADDSVVVECVVLDAIRAGAFSEGTK